MGFASWTICSLQKKSNQPRFPHRILQTRIYEKKTPKHPGVSTPVRLSYDLRLPSGLGSRGFG